MFDKLSEGLKGFQGLAGKVENITHPEVETNVKIDTKIYWFVGIIVLLIIFRKKIGL